VLLNTPEHVYRGAVSRDRDLQPSVEQEILAIVAVAAIRPEVRSM